MISMVSDWVSFLAYPNLFGIKGFIIVVVDFYWSDTNFLALSLELPGLKNFGLVAVILWSILDCFK
jgi:hypothetical protein